VSLFYFLVLVSIEFFVDGDYKIEKLIKIIFVIKIEFVLINDNLTPKKLHK